MGGGPNQTTRAFGRALGETFDGQLLHWRARRGALVVHAVQATLRANAQKRAR